MQEKSKSLYLKKIKKVIFHKIKNKLMKLYQNK